MPGLQQPDGTRGPGEAVDRALRILRLELQTARILQHDPSVPPHLQAQLATLIAELEATLEAVRALRSEDAER